MLMPSEQNYHSSKLEILALKWSITEHFKEYLAYAPFTVHTDNNPLTYVLTTPNLDATRHCWVGALMPYEFTLEYQKGSENTVADVLSWVPMWHDKDTVWSLLEGAVTFITERGEVLISRPWEWNVIAWMKKHLCMWLIGRRHRVRMCCWLPAISRWAQKRNITPQKRDALLKICMGEHSNSEEGKALFCIRNNLTIKKGLMYVNIMPKGETEGLLAFVVPSTHRHTALNGVHWDARHQGQHRMLALVEECFWWPKMVEDCWASVRGCQHCKIFKGAVVKALLCPIKAYAPLELVHVDFTR